MQRQPAMPWSTAAMHWVPQLPLCHVQMLCHCSHMRWMPTAGHSVDAPLMQTYVWMFCVVYIHGCCHVHRR